MTFDLLAQSPTLWIGTALVLGLAVGSFLNVVIHRLPKMMQAEWEDGCAQLHGQTPAVRERYNLMTPASSCPACGHRIRAWENIPVLSWLGLRGKCSGCSTRIAARYPLVELLTGVLSAAIAWRFGFGFAACAALLLLWALIALTFIDFDTQLLPDSLTLPLLWLGLLVNLRGAFVPLPDAVLGAVAGYLFLWGVYWLFKLATGKEGMGAGDFKLLAAIGAWLGWKMLLPVILLSSLVGATVGIALMLLARLGRGQPIPFGPYLAGGGLIALFAGDALLRGYFNLFA
jgi:leader peptidase (prepilin peptidase)/N-methyltransferase